MNTTLKQQMAILQKAKGLYLQHSDQWHALNDAGSTIAAYALNLSIIKDRLRDIKKMPELKKRNYPASIEVNAPLALIQVSLAAELKVLEMVSGVERTKLPL